MVLFNQTSHSARARASNAFNQESNPLPACGPPSNLTLPPENIVGPPHAFRVCLVRLCKVLQAPPGGNVIKFIENQRTGARARAHRKNLCNQNYIKFIASVLLATQTHTPNHLVCQIFTRWNCVSRARQRASQKKLPPNTQ